MRVLRAIGLTILLFVAVYAPASALAAALHLQIAATVPFVMFFTLVTALIGIRLLAGRTPGGLVRYGFSVPVLNEAAVAQNLQDAARATPGRQDSSSGNLKLLQRRFKPRHVPGFEGMAGTSCVHHGLEAAIVRAIVHPHLPPACAVDDEPAA